VQKYHWLYAHRHNVSQPSDAYRVLYKSLPAASRIIQEVNISSLEKHYSQTVPRYINKIY